MLGREALMLSLICWILICQVCSLNNIAVFKGRSQFSFSCQETTPFKGNAYNYNSTSDSYKYIADADKLLPGEAHRYSMSEFQATRTIVYTQPTDQYADNEYHDCIKEYFFGADIIHRAVFVVLDDFQCSVNDKKLKVLRGEDFLFSASLNFTHISPEFTCTTEGVGSTSIDHFIEYSDNVTERSLKGRINANVALKYIGLEDTKVSCAFKYDSLENLKTEEMDHIEELPKPQLLIAVEYKQPKMFFNDDQDKMGCKVSVTYEYGPDNVMADLHPVLLNNVYCSYNAVYSSKNRTIWKVNGSEVDGAFEDVLNITNIARPADITCEPCIEFFNGEINCTMSGIFQLLDNSTLPVIKPQKGKHLPKNVAIYEDQTKPFRFYCHAYPNSPLTISSSSFGPGGNLIADQNGIVPGQNHRYRMETDEYFTRIIEYNASSIAAYDDNIYHDCNIKENNTHRAVVAVLSNLVCPEGHVRGVEDTKFNLTYKIDFTHIEPEVRCDANMLGTVRFDLNVISNDTTKPLKSTLIVTLRFDFPKRSGTFANCSFIYNPEEFMYPTEAIHIGELEPSNVFLDVMQPTWAHEEDKEKPRCHTKMEIQYGPTKVTVNPLNENILSCDYESRDDRFLYANWIFDGVSKFNSSLSVLDVSNEPSANVVCEPCVQFFNLEIRCAKSESFSWNSSVTTRSPQTTKITNTPSTTGKTSTIKPSTTDKTSTIKPSTTDKTSTIKPSTTDKTSTTKPSTTDKISTATPTPTSDSTKLTINNILGATFIVIQLFVYFEF